MGENWRKSQEHYQNIINPDYTRVSHQIKIRKSYIFVCQVFTSTPFVGTYTYKKGKKMYIRKGKPCKNCNTTREKLSSDQGFIGWYTVSNDSLYYWNLKYYDKPIKVRLEDFHLQFRIEK